MENQASTLSELNEAKDKMQKSFEELGKEAMKYANPPASEDGPVEEASESTEESEPKKDDDIVDADFEVVDDENDKSEK